MLRRCVRLWSCKEMLGYACRAKINTNFGRVLYSSLNKDLLSPKLQTPLSNAYSHDSSFLLDQIKEAETLESILEVFSNHQDIINAHHIVALLKSLHDHSKLKGLNPAALRENQTFQSICTRLMKEVHALETHEVVAAYRVLTSLGIRNNSHVVQSVLRTIGRSLSGMDLEQLASLSHVLSRQKHNALVDDLRLALPLVLQVRIDRTLDSGDVSRAVDCLDLVNRSRLKPVTVQKIVSSILTKANSLSASNAATVISTLAHVDTPVDGYKQLLDAAFEIVTENLPSLDERQVLDIFNVCREKGLYRETFFSEASKKVVAERWSLENTRKMLDIFNAMRFRSRQLKEYFDRVSCLEADAKARTMKTF